MPKLGGILQVYNEREYLEPCLKQSLEHYDELIVLEGCHSNGPPTRSTDGTVEYLLDNKIDFVLAGPKEGQRYDLTQCTHLGMALNELKERGCDWFRFIDVDMIFNDRDLGKAKDIMDSTSKDCLTFNERRFIFNWKINTHDTTGYFYRVVPDMYISPISRMHYADGGTIREDSVEQLGITCFHFTSAKKLARMRFRFRISQEKGTPDIPEMWGRYSNYDVNSKLDKDEIEALVGGFGANIYTGDFPEVLKDHPYRFANDIRSIE